MTSNPGAAGATSASAANDIDLLTDEASLGAQATGSPGAPARRRPRGRPVAKDSAPGAVWLARGVTLGDQVLSSVSNVLAVALVARVLDQNQFGRFALGYTMLTLTLALSRAYFGNRLSMVGDRLAAQRLAADLVVSIVILAPLATLVVLGASLLVTGGASLDILVIVAVATPVVCAQDILRFGASASRRGWTALCSDGVWVLIMLAPFVGGLRLSSRSALLLWAIGAVAAFAVALLTCGCLPSFRSGVRELRRPDRLGTSVAVGSVISALSSLWVLAAVARLIGPAVAGSLRGASTAMGPINVLIAFVPIGLTPMLVSRPRKHDLRFCALVSGGLMLAMLVWGSVLLAVPHDIGEAAFGDSWSGIRRILPWTVAEYVCLCAAMGAVLGLRVRHRASALLRQTLCAGVVTAIGGTVIAAVTHRSWAVAAVLTCAALLLAVLAWFHLHLPEKHSEPRGAAALAGLSETAETLARRQRTGALPESVVVGYTAGVFDMFHGGHVSLLRRARERCDHLIVGVTSDELAASLKGAEPVIPFLERSAIVASVRYVDAVVPQMSTDKVDAWAAVKFDVVFVGDNVAKAPEWAATESALASRGATVVVLPATYDRAGYVLDRDRSDQLMAE